MPYSLPGQAFIHEANAGNIERNYTYINSNLTNNQPDAIVFVTERWNPKKRNYNDVSLGVWYNKGKWSIYNHQREDDHTYPPMKPGTLFNVFVQSPVSEKDLEKTPPLVPQKTSLQRSRRLMILSYAVLVLSILWLSASFGLYFLQNASAQHWQEMFFMPGNPLLSLSLLVLAVLMLLLFLEQRWGSLFTWFSQLDPLKQPIKTSMLLSIVFFVGLLLLSLTFPHMTGYTFKSDWSLLVSATIPLLALVALIVINRYQSLKFASGNITFEFSGVMMTPENDPAQTIMLDIPLEEKTIDAWLSKIKTKTMPTEARILIVQFDGQTPLEFPALQKYVHEIIIMSPITYLVFISSMNFYLGFLTVERFKTLSAVNLSQITEGNVQAQLSIDKLAIGESKAKSTVAAVYELLVQHHLPGIPVLDESNHFLGMMEKNKIEQAVIMRFLENTAKQTDKTPATEK